MEYKMNTASVGKSLAQLQYEIGLWANRNFGMNISKDMRSASYNSPLDTLCPLMGMIEELGELSRVVNRRHQGRGYDDYDKAQHDKEDALADLLIFMCDFACRENIDLQGVLNYTWSKVEHRAQATWVEDKRLETESDDKRLEAESTKDTTKLDTTSKDIIIQGKTNEDVIQDGHGFGQPPACDVGHHRWGDKVSYAACGEEWTSHRCLDCGLVETLP